MPNTTSDTNNAQQPDAEPLGSLYKTITLIDIQLASVYYSILVGMAKEKRCLTYGDLVENAKCIYPDNPVIKMAIPVSTGRRLDVIRLFTTDNDLPDITSLVTNKSSGECGVGFTSYFDPKATRESVFNFDWNSATAEFNIFLSSTEEKIKPRKRIKESDALKIMYEYYKVHKNTLPTNIKDARDLILELIAEGIPAENAFSESLRSRCKAPD